MILACKCPEQFMGTFWSTFTKVILFLGIDFSEKVCVDIVTSNSLHLCFFTFLFRCRNLTFPDRLPEVSIVFIFVNEALSVILRSIHSAIDRTPAHLLKEIILVDDNSNNGKRFLVFFFFFFNLFSSYRGWIIHENPWILAPIHAISISDVFSIFFPFLIPQSCWALSSNIH